MLVGVHNNHICDDLARFNCVARFNCEKRSDTTPFIYLFIYSLFGKIDRNNTKK